MQNTFCVRWSDHASDSPINEVTTDSYPKAIIMAIELLPTLGHDKGHCVMWEYYCHHTKICHSWTEQHDDCGYSSSEEDAEDSKGDGLAWVTVSDSFSVYPYPLNPSDTQELCEIKQSFASAVDSADGNMGEGRRKFLMADGHQNPRFLDTPCSACGKALIEYTTTGVYTFNSHLSEEERIHYLKQWSSKNLPIYKCGVCKIAGKRSNPNRHCTKAIGYGYCAEPSCKALGHTCKNWDHYTTRD